MDNKSYRNSPLKQRICNCGCDIEFWPKRKDQVYLDSRHANFHYNHYKRHKKNKKNEINKMLKKNDEILRFHYEKEKLSECYIPLDEILNDGFKPEYFIAIDNTTKPFMYFSYYFTYSNYLTKNEDKYIKITKR